MAETNDLSQAAFLLIGAVVVVLFAIRGWRLGLVRQALSIVSLAAAYLVAFLGGKYLIPVLRPLGFPDQVLTVLGGLILGVATYAALSIASGVLFKRTEHQSATFLRFGFGFSGAILGAVFGLFLLLVGGIGIRLLGSIAEHELKGRKGKQMSASPVASRLAHIKKSFAESPAGAVVEKVDPIPQTVYQTLGKVGELTADPDSMIRFTENPSVQALSVHPKIVALQNDPEIAKAAEAQDFLSLLRNPKLVEAANDPEVIRLIGTLDLNQALDFALKPQQKPAAR